MFKSAIARQATLTIVFIGAAAVELVHTLHGKVSPAETGELREDPDPACAANFRWSPEQLRVAGYSFNFEIYGLAADSQSAVYGAADGVLRMADAFVLGVDAADDGARTLQRVRDSVARREVPIVIAAESGSVRHAHEALASMPVFEVEVASGAGVFALWKGVAKAVLAARQRDLADDTVSGAC